MKIVATVLLFLLLGVSAIAAGKKKDCGCYQETSGPFPHYWTSSLISYLWFETKKDCKKFLKEMKKHPYAVVTGSE